MPGSQGHTVSLSLLRRDCMTLRPAPIRVYRGAKASRYTLIGKDCGSAKHGAIRKASLNSEKGCDMLFLSGRSAGVQSTEQSVRHHLIPKKVVTCCSYWVGVRECKARSNP